MSKNGKKQVGEDKKPRLLFIAALGVVYGDIGTSPLYALREAFGSDHGAQVSQEHIFGVLSLIFWALILIITVKYILFILRADNQGEGGILALMQLVLPDKEEDKGRHRKLILILGLFGAALLYGDGILTPAISVLSAVEGIEIATPDLGGYVIPIAIAILLFLFWFQKRGTAKVGRFFGIVMLVWFAVLGVLGILQIIQTPEILGALNPWHGIRFLSSAGMTGLFVLGAVFLAVTGGEALYADIGHFGTGPIRKAWFAIVLPGLLLNYFGQGGLLLENPGAIENPFYLLAPEWALIPLIVLATMATIIASQAIISGAFSLTFQAVQFNYLPRLRILHTSRTESGQVYLPRVNIILLVATIGVVLLFRNSSNLAVAYGIAIAVTMVITDVLAYYAMRKIWKWKFLPALGATIGFLIVDLTFLTANGLKFLQGGWFPILVALLIYLTFRMWMRGQEQLEYKFSKYNNNLSEFVENFDRGEYASVEGTAIYLTPEILRAPVALQHNLKHNKMIHNQVIILSIGYKNHPRMMEEDRMVIDELGKDFTRVLVKYGYMENVRMPDILESWKEEKLLKPYLNELTFFVSRATLLVESSSYLEYVQDAYYIFLRKNSLDATRFYELPTDDVFEVGLQLKI